MSCFRTVRILVSIHTELGETYEFEEDLELKSEPIGFPDSESERNIASQERYVALKVCFKI